jgi:hypothetical protein
MKDAIGALVGDDDDDPSPTIKVEGDTRKLAQTYAWEYFKYHAQQRQAAFRFFLVIVAALVAAVIPKDSNAPIWLVGSMMVLASYLFWRLDQRNAALVKLAETYLKEEELRLSAELNSESIKILHRSDQPKRSHKFTSYTQIHRLIFIVVGLVGFALLSPGLGSVAAKLGAIFEGCVVY